MLNNVSPIWVNAAQKRYPIWIGWDLLSQAAFFQPFFPGQQVFILSHPEIATHYLTALVKTCEAAGARQIDHWLVAAGEDKKNLKVAQEIWQGLIERYHERQTTIIALGGGMISDLAGFCAACYLRGVAVIHCPTTLLAQVDAAIGGKTAINYLAAKNNIGAFYPPQAVVIDLQTLTTLPQREYIAGLAELIKYGLIVDSDFFEWLEVNHEKLVNRDKVCLEKAVRHGASLKAQIVEEDEKEQGKRILLNFGHTVAHAIESLLDYQDWLHGEAVAAGMIVALQLSIRKWGLEEKVCHRVVSLLKNIGLPTNLPSTITIESILNKIKQDKKHRHRRLRWVLLHALGEGKACEDVSASDIFASLEQVGVR